MKVTCVSGVTLQLLLVPETPVEIAFLQEMSVKSERGEKTKLMAAAEVDNRVPSNIVERHILEIG